LPRVSSCWMAAGRRRSAAMSRDLWFWRRRCRASLAAVVVLPEPCRPTNMMVVTGWLERVSEWSPPLSRDVNSSWTIFTTCWPGERLSRISEPMARSFTAATKSRATRKLTSASSRERRTRLRASSMSPSVKRPLLVSLLRMPVKRSVRFSNISALVAFATTFGFLVLHSPTLDCRLGRELRSR